MAQTTVIRYEDGNIGIRRAGIAITMDQILLVGTLEQVMSTLRFELLGYGVSLSDEELERIAWRITQLLQ